MFAVPQTPVVLIGPAVQSALVQHPTMAMHTFVPRHRLKSGLQAIPQVPEAPPVQVAEPLADGAGHDTQLAPQKVVLVSGWQMPLQLCVPVGQGPHGVFVGIHAPAHTFVPLGHAGWHARPSQVAVPPIGTSQGIQEVLSFGPHVATALLSTHLPPHWWKPALHMTAHAPLTQTALPLGSVRHTRQLVPQPVGSLSDAQRPEAPMPHRCVPGAQAKSQLVPSHVVALAPVGFGHALQLLPHESTLVFVAQMPLQS